MGFRPKNLERVALIYATFPRPTETFVRRELRAMCESGLKPYFLHMERQCQMGRTRGKQVYHY